jgi:hypothetical protein
MTPAESAKAGPAGHAAAYGRQVRADVSVLFVQDFEPAPDWKSETSRAQIAVHCGDPPAGG